MPATLKSRFPEIAASLRPKLDAALAATAEDIANLARERAPVGETGNLKASIHVEREGDAVYRVLAGDETVDYGVYVEYGANDRAPRPFLVPASELGIRAGIAFINAMLRSL